MTLRFLQLVISTAAAFVAFLGLDTLNVPLSVGALGVGFVLDVVIGLIRRANNKERQRAGLPRAASATFGVGVAFLLLNLAGSVGAAAVVWATDTCTMQVGTYNANITLTGFYSKAVCNNVERSAQNKVLGVLGVVGKDFADKVPLSGGLFRYFVGSAQFHDSSPTGNEVCTGWYRQARWAVITVRDQSNTGLDVLGNRMCNSLKGQGLLTYPWG